MLPKGVQQRRRRARDLGALPDEAAVASVGTECSRSRFRAILFAVVFVCVFFLVL